MISKQYCKHSRDPAYCCQCFVETIEMDEKILKNLKDTFNRSPAFDPILMLVQLLSLSEPELEMFESIICESDRLIALHKFCIFKILGKPLDRKSFQ